MSRFPPTPQQAAVIEAMADPKQRVIKVEACAGSGKTTLLTMCALALVVPSLYLAFNKVTATEGSEKFPKHVTCSTTHSVAYRAATNVVRNKLSRPSGRYQNVAGTGSEICKFYQIDSIRVDEDTTISGSYMGLLVKQALARFEQSADLAIGLEHCGVGDYYDRLKAVDGAIKYVKNQVLAVARRMWADRINPATPVLATHDTYLKLFQLSKPVLHGYEVLYVDEFQDTTPCVLDIVMNQTSMKIVIVGDARQAIYGWRGAINAMLMVDAPSYPLTKSFRYGQAVADVATAVLERDMVITGNEAIISQTRRANLGLLDETKPYARLFRTNGALLESAVTAIQARQSVAIEIDVKDFAKLLESAQALRDRNMKEVKHEKMLAYREWDEAKLEAKHDAELKRVVKIVEEGRSARFIEILLNFNNFPDPHITFTTAHKSKGREWHQVRVEEDFPDGYNEAGEWVGLSTEEQNLLYVAVTRAQYVLEYNNVASTYVNYDISVEGQTAEEVDEVVMRAMDDDTGFEDVRLKLVKEESKLVRDLVGN